MRSFFSSFFSSGVDASCAFGSVERARFAPRTTRMRGTATPPALLHGAGDGVVYQRPRGEEEVLQLRDRRNEERGEHRPERGVHLPPHAGEEAGGVVGYEGDCFLKRGGEAAEEVLPEG